MEEHVSSVLARLRRRTGSGLTFLGRVEGEVLTIGRFDGPVVGPLRGARLEPGEGLGGRVLAEGRPEAVVDYVGSTAISHRYDAIIRAESLRSMAAAPVVVNRRSVAVLYASSRAPLGEAGRLQDAVVEEGRALEQGIAVERARRDALAGSDDDALSPLWRARVREAHSALRELAASISDPARRHRALEAAEALVEGPVPEAARHRYTVLTTRETDVLTMLGAGLSNRAAAESLGISVHTVKSHVKHLMAKLDVTTRHEAVVTARRRGLLP